MFILADFHPSPFKYPDFQSEAPSHASGVFRTTSGSSCLGTNNARGGSAQYRSVTSVFCIIFSTSCIRSRIDLELKWLKILKLFVLRRHRTLVLIIFVISKHVVDVPMQAKICFQLGLCEARPQ